MSNQPTCATCRFWAGSQYYPGSGLCRRNPPTATTIRYVSDGYTEFEHPTAWPTTDDDDWCGEHVPRTIGP